MTTGRMEAFSDGVIAILITIMVLELRVPTGQDLEALRPLLPVLISYVLSFVNLGIWWTNHHHLLQASHRVDGRVLWANLHLLFWLSLFPFATGWMGENEFAPIPVAIYGVMLLMASIAYFILVRALIARDTRDGHDSVLAQAVGSDRKGKISLAMYAVAVATALVAPWLSFAIYIAVAVIWFVPDLRIERTMAPS